jgi:hypothetical protein
VKIHAKWDNGSDVSGGIIYLGDKNSLTNSRGWTEFEVLSLSVEKQVFRITAVDCQGVTEFSQPIIFPSIIWDRVNVTLSIGVNRVDVGTDADVSYTAFYEYDESSFEDNVNIRIIDDQNSAQTTGGKAYYGVESINDNKYGLTKFVSNKVECIWDKVKIIQGGVTSELTKTGNIESVWFKAIYEYDGKEFTGVPLADNSSNKLFVNGVPMIWSSFEKTWKYSTKLDDNGTLTFKVTGIEDISYKLTKYVDAVGLQSITWEKPFIETPLGMLSVVTVLALIIAGVIFVIRKRL